MTRVFSSPSIFMQRIAWLRAAAFHGSSKMRSAPELSSILYRVGSAAMTPMDSDIEPLREYVKARQADRRFEAADRIPAQDLWLSRSGISWNGSLTRESVNEVPSWAVAFGVSKSRTFTPTSLGRRLVTARSVVEDADWTTATRNPFVLEAAERLVALEMVWQADGDLLAEWLPLLPVGRTFDRIEAGDLLEPALREVAKKATGREALEYERLRAGLAKQVEGAARRGVREHWATPRLEQLVDLGFLEKGERARFQFKFSPSGARIRNHPDHQGTLLDLARLAWAPRASEAPIQEATQALVSAYLRARSALGLAEIEDMWVLANSKLLFAESPSWISRQRLDDQVRAWLSAGDASFNVDKLGRIKYVKLNRALLESDAVG